jgi:predicted DNA-binding transcriptional regulator AlpA
MSDELAAYPVDGFCDAHSISRSLLYKMFRDGTGPRIMRIGARVLISKESAAEWRRDREKAAPVKVENGPPPPAKVSNGWGS